MCEQDSTNHASAMSGRTTRKKLAFRKFEKELQQLSYDISNALNADLELLKTVRNCRTHGGTFASKQGKDHLEKGFTEDSKRSVGSAEVTMASSLITDAASVSGPCNLGSSPYETQTRRNPIRPLTNLSFDSYASLSQASKLAMLRRNTRPHGAERRLVIRVFVESPTTSDEDGEEDSDASSDRTSKGSI
jgi:hypothetical protein